MTEQEAVEVMKWYSEEDYGAGSIVAVSHQMAIKALEKQIPKKVIPRHIKKYDGFDDGECPTCGNSVLRDAFSNDVYCDECGQKLDWEG